MTLPHCAYLYCEAPVTTKIDAELCDRHCQDVYHSVSALRAHATIRQIAASIRTSGLARPQAGRVLGTVYFVRLGDRVKIGYSTNVQRRLRVVPHDEVLATTPGTMKDEKTLHMRFGSLWIEGEWFRAEGELLDYIETLRAA